MELASVSTIQLQFVPVVGSIPTSYHMLNFTLNSLMMELVGGLVDAEAIDQCLLTVIIS